MPIIDMEEYMSKALAAAVFAVVLLTFRAEAADVTLLVIETGLPQEDGNKQHSMAWENALLDACFEAGHVVTNAPLMRLDGKITGDFPDEASGALEEARDWGSDFFIIALLDYEEGGKIPRTISLKLFRINLYQYEKTHELKFPGRSYRSLKEESDNLKSIAQGLAARVNDR